MARVLVVDDESGVRDIIRLTLSRINIDVIETQTAENALSQVSQSSPDLVITDLHLPTMDGVELSRRIHLINPTMPVVFISAAIELQSLTQLSPVEFFLEKPFKIQRLQALVQELLIRPT